MRKEKPRLMPATNPAKRPGDLIDRSMNRTKIEKKSKLAVWDIWVAEVTRNQIDNEQIKAESIAARFPNNSRAKK